MKKINLICIILLFITSLFIITSFTILNKHYTKFIFEKNNFYTEIYKRINADKLIKNTNYKLDIKDVKKDINEYIKSRYMKHFNSKIELSYIKTDDLYNKYISFDKLNIKYKNIYIYLFEILTIVLIVITGDIFMRNKSKLNISRILIFTGILLLITYASLFISINIKDIIINKIVFTSFKVLLGYSIFMISLGIFYKYDIFNKIINVNISLKKNKNKL